MELEGKIYQVLPQRSGTSERTGNSWMSQDYVIEYFWWPNQTFTTKMVMRVFGEDRIKKFNLQAGDEVRLRYHIEGNQVGERWFNDVRIDGVTFIGASAGKNQPTAPNQPAQAAIEPPTGNQPQPEQNAPTAQENGQEAKDDDLPF